MSKAKIPLLLCALLLSVSFSLKAQSDDSTTLDKHPKEIKMNQGFFSELADNLAIQAQSPFHMTRRQTAHFVAGVGITVGLLFLDQAANNYVYPMWKKYKNQQQLCNHLTEFGGNYGFGVAALFAGYSFAFQNKRGMETSRLLAQALITTSVWTRVGKVLTGRQRPFSAHANIDADESRWSGPGVYFSKEKMAKSASNYDAFPSGHTSTAFAIATVFATQYKDLPAVPIVAYSLASIIGLSRMYEHEHWASDVFVGGCIGYLCGKQVCNNHKKYSYCLDYSDKALSCVYSLQF